jgi:hypothetical protein
VEPGDGCHVAPVEGREGLLVARGGGREQRRIVCA